MYSDTSWLGRIGFDDSPTTATVRYLLRISATGSRPCAPSSEPSARSTLISSTRQFWLSLALCHHASERRRQLVVLFRSAHRNANRFGKSHPAERAYNHAEMQQFVANCFCLRPHVHKHEICFALHRPEAQIRQLFAKTRSLSPIHFNTSCHVRVILQRRQRRGLRDARGVERRAQLVHGLQQFRLPNRVPNAKSRQSKHFRKRPQNQ